MIVPPKRKGKSSQRVLRTGFGIGDFTHYKKWYNGVVYKCRPISFFVMSTRHRLTINNFIWIVNYCLISFTNKIPRNMNIINIYYTQ